MTSRNVLVLCGGKWVALIIDLKKAMSEVEQLAGGRIIVADMAEFTPAGYYSDGAFVVPRVADPGYVDAVLDICLRNNVRVVIPHIDMDLERLSPHLSMFEDNGISVVCPPPELVDLCLDKEKFECFAREEGLQHPRTWDWTELTEDMFPVFAKRRRGFGSIGSGVCSSFHEVHRRLEQFPDIMFQELMSGPEISVDAFISVTGKCTVRVQRVRDKVVGGEAIISHTVKWPAARDLASRTIDALSRRGLRGPLNVQLFAGDKPALVEVNTRLASACPLSNVACGGRLYRSVLLEACGGVSEGDPEDYLDDLSLYRFYGELIHRGAEALAAVPATEVGLDPRDLVRSG